MEHAIASAFASGDSIQQTPANAAQSYLDSLRSTVLTGTGTGEKTADFTIDLDAMRSTVISHIEAINATSPVKAITAFDFNTLSPAVTGSVNETDHTIALTVPYGTNVTNLVPTITQTGASISPNSGVAHDFTTPATYTVTAGDATTRDYLVTVTVDTPTPTPIENIEDAVIDITPTEITPNSDQSNPTIDHVVATSTLDTLTITWKTDRNTASIVRYGTDKNLKEKKKDIKKEKTHKVVLKGLRPDTKYYFHIKAEDSDNNEDSSRIHSIVTQAVVLKSKSNTNEISTQNHKPTENIQSPNSFEVLKPKICSYTIQFGDSLWSIAKKVYGDATAYPLIIDKNKEKYPNIESKLSIGQELTFGCSDTQSPQNTENKVIIDNANQHSQSPSQIQPQTENESFKWWNPFTWF